MMHGNGMPPAPITSIGEPLPMVDVLKKSPARLCTLPTFTILCPRGRHQEIDRGAR